MFGNLLNYNPDNNLNSGMPNMAQTLTGWEQNLTFTKLKQDIIDGDLVVTGTNINFIGVWQPLSMERLQSKPDEQRSWEWIWVHSKSNLELNTADKIMFNDKRYKVMSKKDYSLNGFYEYEIVRDYIDAA